MLYDSLDIIPLKTYMKITDTGDITLLTDEHDNFEVPKLQKIWNKLRDEYNTLGISNGAKKVIDVTQRIELLRTKYDFITAAVNVLGFEREMELENQLREFGYKLRATQEHYFEDLKRIRLEAENVLIKAKRLNEELAKGKPSGGKSHTIDTVIMGYMSATGIQYDTNTITVMQFDALKNIFEQKLEELQKQNAKAKSAAAKLKKR